MIMPRDKVEWFRVIISAAIVGTTVALIILFLVVDNIAEYRIHGDAPFSLAESKVIVFQGQGHIDKPVYAVGDDIVVTYQAKMGTYCIQDAQIRFYSYDTGKIIETDQVEMNIQDRLSISYNLLKLKVTVPRSVTSGRYSIYPLSIPKKCNAVTGTINFPLSNSFLVK